MFLSTCNASFRSSCKAGLVVMKSLSTCLFIKDFIFPSIVKLRLDVKFWVESSFLFSFSFFFHLRENYMKSCNLFFIFIFYCILGFGVHVQSMQYSCIGTHMAVCSDNTFNSSSLAIHYTCIYILH